jgi:hypothetical protein
MAHNVEEEANYGATVLFPHTWLKFIGTNILVNITAAVAGGLAVTELAGTGTAVRLGIVALAAVLIGARLRAPKSHVVLAMIPIVNIWFATRLVWRWAALPNRYWDPTAPVVGAAVVAQG